MTQAVLFQIAASAGRSASPAGVHRRVAYAPEAHDGQRRVHARVDVGGRAARGGAHLRVELRSAAQGWYASLFGCVRQWRISHSCAARTAARSVKLPLKPVCIQWHSNGSSHRPRDQHKNLHAHSPAGRACEQHTHAFERVLRQRSNDALGRQGPAPSAARRPRHQARRPAHAGGAQGRASSVSHALSVGTNTSSCGTYALRRRSAAPAGRPLTSTCRAERSRLRLSPARRRHAASPLRQAVGSSAPPARQPACARRCSCACQSAALRRPGLSGTPSRRQRRAISAARPSAAGLRKVWATRSPSAVPQRRSGWPEDIMSARNATAQCAVSTQGTACLTPKCRSAWHGLQPLKGQLLHELERHGALLTCCMPVI